MIRKKDDTEALVEALQKQFPDAVITVHEIGPGNEELPEEE